MRQAQRDAPLSVQKGGQVILAPLAVVRRVQPGRVPSSRAAPPRGLHIETYMAPSAPMVALITRMPHDHTTPTPPQTAAPPPHGRPRTPPTRQAILSPGSTPGSRNLIVNMWDWDVCASWDDGATWATRSIHVHIRHPCEASISIPLVLGTFLAEVCSSHSTQVGWVGPKGVIARQLRRGRRRARDGTQRQAHHVPWQPLLVVY